MEEKFVYSFYEGSKEQKQLLGGKGANLAEMKKIGLPVSSGFTITTQACDIYYKNNKSHPIEVINQINENLAKLEEEMGKKLGDESDPLLVSVRSGAAVSMPGMMDTVLNLGLNDNSVIGLATKTNNERFALDAYRRFIQMFGDVVMEVSHSKFEEILENKKKERNVATDVELNSQDLKEVIESYKKVIRDTKGYDFPQNPREQLQMAIDAVFNSWNNERAIFYRKLNNIKGLLGTAVNVQAMVFGNMGNTSGTGVCFTRNPSNGENKFYGEFLINAQGEDVVAGIRTPQSIEELKEIMPEIYNELVDIREKLENHYKDMQDIEFTIQEGKLYILQTRNGKRTGNAAVNIAIDLLEEGKISEEEAILRIDPNSLNQLLHKQINENKAINANIIAKGLPASPGAAVGKIVFNAMDAKSASESGEKVILVRNETSPEDIIGMDASQGILTARGGMTSHAAVVARGMGKCCVAGCSELNIDEETKTITVKNIVLKEGDFITLNGTTGAVYNCELELEEPTLSGNFEKLMKIADKYRRLQIRTNADTPKDAQTALNFGAQGIGLCRTEHMFFGKERIKAVREMILSKTKEQREIALKKVLPFQKSDFKGIYSLMLEKPVTIRLLDPPLHEFLPNEESEIEDLAKSLNIAIEEIRINMEKLEEVNPMMGHRGCRLGITYPEITEMQIRAIMEAAIEVSIEKNINIVPEIMVPLIGNVNELTNQKNIIIETINKVFEEKSKTIDYKIGTMIETPRAALCADKIVKEADFFSFGTNDLTQMTLGFSRDDVGKFLGYYLDKNIIEEDPFESLDTEGPGQLVEMAVIKSRNEKPDFKLGICGEHGGNPKSIDFCEKVGLNYVSCSPFRVPIARLAAAQSTIKNNK
ncbi:MAG: pyruvate, phosphate dikinase [Candidatus Nanoarchaeia archaeon]|nr:pyruvate, phosphate dikinase [Candidatus Nanoarchaeia archaeon]